jgi:uncharacterized membrane protein YkoI
MDRERRRWPAGRTVVIAALAVGVAAGSYGVASAATGSSSKAPRSSAAPRSGQPWGHQRSDETALTGTTAAKVRELALAKVPGGSVVRVETDADGNAAYEAHMVKADGTPATVYVSKAFEVVSVQTGMPGPPGAAPSSSGASA